MEVLSLRALEGSNHYASEHHRKERVTPQSFRGKERLCLRASQEMIFAPQSFKVMEVLRLNASEERKHHTSELQSIIKCYVSKLQRKEIITHQTFKEKVLGLTALDERKHYTCRLHRKRSITPQGFRGKEALASGLRGKLMLSLRRKERFRFRASEERKYTPQSLRENEVLRLKASEERKHYALKLQRKLSVAPQNFRGKKMLHFRATEEIQFYASELPRKENIRLHVEQEGSVSPRTFRASNSNK